MNSSRRSLALVGVLTALSHGCLGDDPAATSRRSDAGADAGDASNDPRDARAESQDGSGDAHEAGSETGASGPCANVEAGRGCARSGAPGVCNAFGACVECLTEGDAHCAGEKPHCTSAYTCVECTLNAHCNPTTEKCRNGSCIQRCGDGVVDPDEDCEQGIAGWTVNNCNFQTCKRTVYENCRGDSTRCSQQVLCTAAFTCMEQSDNNCVTSCPDMPGYVIGCSSGLCYINCASGPCPGDTHCTRDVAVGSASVDMCFGN